MSTTFRPLSFLIVLTVCCVLSARVRAEETATRTWVAMSGLNSFFQGHLVRLTLFEAGAATATSRAIIELRDRANRIVARKEGSLTSRSPLQVDLKLGATAGLLQLRAIITIVSDTGDVTAPLVTFEDIHPDLGLVIKVDPPCGPGHGPVDPQASCPPGGGWLVSTTEE